MNHALVFVLLSKCLMQVHSHQEVKNKICYVYWLYLSKNFAQFVPFCVLICVTYSYWFVERFLHEPIPESIISKQWRML
jgi:hypothetical protein